MHSITWKHLLTHGYTLAQYRKEFPNSPTRTFESILRKKEGAKRANERRRGIPRSDIIKEKIRATKANNPQPAWNKDVPITKTQKYKQSNTMKKKFESGELVHWNKGNTISDEIRQKISRTLSAKQQHFSQKSKERREKTIQEKIKNGWIHQSTRRKGVPITLSDDAKKRIAAASLRANYERKRHGLMRLYEHLHQYNLCIVGIDQDNYNITLECNTCGHKFTRTSSVLTPYRYHIYQGQYCPVCFPPERGYFSSAFFEKYPEKRDHPAIFYFAILSSEDEIFLKIGITTRTAHMRLLGEPYVHEIILELRTTLFEAYKLEQQILSSFDRYQPKKEFGGMTECLNLRDCDSILESIDNTAAALNIPIHVASVDTQI
jgi:hypothetical protein